MKNPIRLWTAGVLGAMLLILAACGGGGAPAGTGGGAPAGNTLTLNADTIQLAFDQTELTTTAGAPTTLTLNNPAPLEHNWVLIRGDEAAAVQVNQEGIAAGPNNGYIPNDPERIIAHTALVQPNGSDTITFTVDQPGSYIYICTVPGHYDAGMRGVLTVN